MHSSFVHVSVGQIIKGPVAAMDGAFVRPTSHMHVHLVLRQMMRPAKPFAALFANVLLLLWSHVAYHVVLKLDSRRKQLVAMRTGKLLRMSAIPV